MEKIVHNHSCYEALHTRAPHWKSSSVQKFYRSFAILHTLDCFLHRNLSRSLLYFVKQSSLPLQGYLKVIRAQSWENYSENLMTILKHLLSLPFLFSTIIKVSSMRTLSILFGVKTPFLVLFIKFHSLGFHISSCCYH